MCFVTRLLCCGFHAKTQIVPKNVCAQINRIVNAANKMQVLLFGFVELRISQRKEKNVLVNKIMRSNLVMNVRPHTGNLFLYKTKS